MSLHSLSLKVALAVAGTAAVLAAAVGFAEGAGSALGAAVLAAALAAVVLGVATYAVTQRLVEARLEETRALLRHLRRFEFEALDAPAGDQRDAERDDERGEKLPERGRARRERRHRADELDALQAETRRTGRVLGEKMEELRKMENYRREFIGNVSHELKTPIFSIRGFSETLLDGALEDENVRVSFVEKIMRNADRLSHLARDLGEIARIETGQLKMTVTTFDLRPLVREVVESLEPVAARKGVALHERMPDALPPVEGDRERLRQVLTNLLDNAIKYNQDGGSVEVAARRVPSGAVKTYVVDDGVGVAPEHIERLTERFYRVDQSRSRSQGGTGLGLAIVKHILGAHGSELTVSSSPDHGSTFGFTLPAAARQAPGEGASAPPAGQERAASEGGDGARLRETPAPREKATP